MTLLEENDMDDDLTHYMEATSRLRAENTRLLSDRQRLVEALKTAYEEGWLDCSYFSEPDNAMRDRCWAKSDARTIPAEMEEG